MKGYRNTDPAESRDAYIQLRDSGILAERQMQVYYCVTQKEGLTSAELSHVMHGAFPNLPIRTAVESPHKRLKELEEAGYVKRGDVRLCRDTNNKAVTWNVRH